jgi:hypothetical protein
MARGKRGHRRRSETGVFAFKHTLPGNLRGILCILGAKSGNKGSSSWEVPKKTMEM